MTVAVDGSRLRVEFGGYDLERYELFLRCKRLPETQLIYDWQSDVYTLTAPARFAHLVDPSILRQTQDERTTLASHLFDYQIWIVGKALDAQRYACWADTGLGKTAIFLEWARQVEAITGEGVLIVSPLQVIEQTREQGRFFYGELDVQRLDSREALTSWCAEPRGIAIANYEKLIPGVLPELRYLGGLVLDESSILKSGGGVIKWNLIKSARGIEYKLSCTATPAPNDSMEYASQASFLEKLRTEGEILWTYFTRDSTGNWRVKPHARKAFFAFMATWSIYMRSPANYGFADILASLPDPQIMEWPIEITSEQRTAMNDVLVKAGSGMFAYERMGVRERSKLSQIAKGFMYDGSAAARTVSHIDSKKPGWVADIVRDEISAGRPTLVWTVFDEESAILSRALGKLPHAVLSGSTPDGERLTILEAFRRGDVPVLISKASLVGYGMNFQHCRAMVFSGFDDSFERMYQAIRRAYRYGQTETVRVHIPYVAELEGMIFENVRQKQGRFEAEASEQEAAYMAALAA